MWVWAMQTLAIVGGSRPAFLYRSFERDCPVLSEDCLGLVRAAVQAHQRQRRTKEHQHYVAILLLGGAVDGREDQGRTVVEVV